jgi:hypothetical protein
VGAGELQGNFDEGSAVTPLPSSSSFSVASKSDAEEYEQEIFTPRAISTDRETKKSEGKYGRKNGFS